MGLKKSTTRIWALSLICSTLAFAEGGASHGGGNTRGSTPEEVRRALKGVSQVEHDYTSDYAFNLKDAFNSLYLNYDASFKRKFPRLVPVLDPMFAAEAEKDFFHSAIYKDLQNTKYAPASDGYCEADLRRHPKAASTGYKGSSSICVSIPALRKIPSGVLRLQLRALLAHEFTHHFGFGEKEANLIQDFFINQANGYIDEDPSVAPIRNAVTYLEQRAHYVSEALNQKNTVIADTSFCTTIGAMTMAASQMRAQVSAASLGESENQSSKVNYFLMDKPSQDAILEMFAIGGFCGDTLQAILDGRSAKSGEFKKVQQGNRGELAASISRLKETLRNLAKQIEAAR